MRFEILSGASILLAASLVQAVTHSRKDNVCTSPRQRRAWHTLTNAEKTSYINGELCLMSTPASSGIPGAVTRWDELQYAHLSQADYIHGVGAFLGFHRWFTTVHEIVLQEECGYRGPMPYWDEPRDIGQLASSPIFNVTTGFGGNGSGSNRCITTGPFASLRLRMGEDGGTLNYCISRNIQERAFASAAPANVDACLARTTFVSAWECLEGRPHSAGHGGVGGIMSNPLISPGDPLFHLHHSYIDSLYWRWQTRDLSRRLTEIGGNNTRSRRTAALPGFEVDSTIENPFGERRFTGQASSSEIIALDAWTDYFGDQGPITTLNHTLWSGNIVENVTLSDVMDIRGNVICAEYI
jgi:tyrosinase